MSFYESPEFLKSSQNIIIFLDVPINLLAFYCIIFRTPPNMKSVKFALLNYGLWNIALDLGLSYATIPFILLPTLSGYPLGILKDFGISTKSQTICIILGMIGVGCSLISIFENRFSHLVNRKSKIINHILIYAINMLATFIGMFYILNSCPDQTLARSIVRAQLPENITYFHESEVFVVSIDNTFVGMFIGFILILIIIQCQILSIATIVKLFSRKNVSRRTKKMQNNFFLLICIQISIPFCALALPLLYVAYTCTTYYHNQALNNIVIIFVSLHGMLSAISMISIHSPYRRALLSKLGIKQKRKLTFRGMSMSIRML